jgi:hypothetical protein
MKKIVLPLLIIVIAGFQVIAQIKVKSDGKIQLAYATNSSLLIDTYVHPSFPGYDNGRWGIEHFNGGLNFWIPWPNPVQNGGNYKLFIEDYTGYVGINEDNPSYDLDVNGDAHVYGQLYVSSDERFKSDINPLPVRWIKSGNWKGLLSK